MRRVRGRCVAAEIPPVMLDYSTVCDIIAWMHQKVVLLIPIFFNDGTPVPQKLLNGILHELYSAYGGYTLAGEVRGAFRMASGTKKTDTLMEVWLAVQNKPKAMELLKERVARFGAILGQEAIYLETSGARIEFVKPNRGEEMDK
jgi:hypothetical protein